MITGRIVGASAVALVLAAMALLAASHIARASTFNPQFSSAVTFSDTTPGGHPDITIPFDILPPSALGGTINFGDPSLTNATDSQLPTGAYIGRISTVAKLGVANEGCATDSPVDFDLIDASTPSTTSALIPGGSGNSAGGNLAEDDGDLDENGSVEHPEFANNGIPDGADAYPTFVRDSLDPDGPGGPGTPVAPIARYFGTAVVAGVLIIPLDIVVLAPGALTVFPNQGWMTPAWGAPSVIILGDPEAPPTYNGISDFCNLSSSSTILGVSHDNGCTAATLPADCASSFAGFSMRKAKDGGCPGSTVPNECGFNRTTNPGSTKTVKARVFAASERDYDGDGHGNSLDVCSYNPNTAWDPRQFNVLSGGDADGDGLPDACDPAPGTPNSDQDADGWPNRADNCPLVANAAPVMNTPNQLQWDQDVPRGLPVGDSGSHADGIGPECDVPGNNCPGCVGNLNPNGPNGHYHATVVVSHVCIGLVGSDSDSDGVCNVDEPPAQDCAGGINDTDCDDDLVSDRFDNCIAGANPRLPNFAQSQRDLNADGFSDITDIALLSNTFGSQGGNPDQDGVGDSAPPGYEGRLDLTFDSFVDISDIAAISGVFGANCR
jgi:Thrombospondin type 3 repeat